MSDDLDDGATLERLAAFTEDPTGGNPAGVWIGGRLPAPDVMRRVAEEVGYSETAFLAPSGDTAGAASRWRVRYFSPRKEIDFCGHATIASAVALGDRHGEGTYVFETAVGDVPVVVGADGGRLTATLTSVAPSGSPADDGLVTEVLLATTWTADDLDPQLPAELAFAGAWHLVLPVRTREVLASLEYEFEALRDVMDAHDLTTIQAVWREDDRTFHSRNPFPVGGVVEDPATGAAAAALGGYLRRRSLVDPPADVVVIQGVDMGRPSRIAVHVPADGGIDVSGAAVRLEP
ncbi:PhzF family phenazine biosynthesis protein [Dermatobacter hominis]|uniref:PhzF family phenazine biosynthesis protein n=1 Tax=Dermatobacter hominis TaxID=2884263 RepID=UPI001D1186A8|nr:PhzF family phenazine biosynthesis isomerase [Dermatobacter hominis]UDY35759.1 PhzF family phenazine biosynthesis protein [Dermatobacter hominis]